jgi:hypothetical protein
MSDPTTPRREHDNGESGADQAPEAQTKPAYAGIGAAIGIGAGIGLVFGTMLDNLALGLACGAGLGTVAGAIMESGRKRP